MKWLLAASAGFVSILISTHSQARPVAVAYFDGSSGHGVAPDVEYLDGTRSYSTDPNAWIARYEWDFGDGSPPYSDSGWVAHTYQVPGHFTARLTVTDSRGDRDSTTLDVQVDGGVTRWTDFVGTYAGAASDGNNIVAFSDGAFREYAPDGSILWDRAPINYTSDGRMVPSTGEIYAWVSTGPRDYRELRLYDPSGATYRVVRSTICSCQYRLAAVDRSGNQAETAYPGGNLYYWRRDAETWAWEFSAYAGTGFEIDAATFDPQGNVIGAGNVRQATTVQGWEVQPGFTIVKLSPSGTVIWIHQIPNVFFWNFWPSLGTSAIGTVVAVISINDTFTWADQTFSPPSTRTYLLVAEGIDGSERFARELQGDEGRGGTLAVDPVGQVAIFAPTLREDGNIVYKYNLAGDFLWRRDLVPVGPEGHLRALSVDISQHNVIVAGTFRGSVDFGQGVQTADDYRGFVVNLGP